MLTWLQAGKVACYFGCRLSRLHVAAATGCKRGMCLWLQAVNVACYGDCRSLMELTAAAAAAAAARAGATAPPLSATYLSSAVFKFVSVW